MWTEDSESTLEEVIIKATASLKEKGIAVALPLALAKDMIDAQALAIKYAFEKQHDIKIAGICTFKINPGRKDAVENRKQLMAEHLSKEEVNKRLAEIAKSKRKRPNVGLL